MLSKQEAISLTKEQAGEYISEIVKEEYLDFIAKCTQSVTPPPTLSATEMQVQQEQAAVQQNYGGYSQPSSSIVPSGWITGSGHVTPGIGNIIGTSNSFTVTTTGGTTPVYDEECEVSRIVKRDGNGYFYVISVDACDEVFYRVWRGGMIPYAWAKVFGRFGRDIKGNGATWQTVTKRTYLPATLGSAYEAIDEAIKEDIEDRNHDQYIKEMLKTEPDSLKMIGSLEQFQEGDVGAPEQDPSAVYNTGSSNSVNGVYSNNIAISGQTLAFTNASSAVESVSASEVEMDKLMLNGTDIEDTMAERIREATEGIKEKILGIEQQIKEKGETKDE